MNDSCYKLQSCYLERHSSVVFWCTMCFIWGTIDAGSLSLTEQRNYSCHFSSFLCFPGWLHTLSHFCLINSVISLVAGVLKSNEVSNGWGFVESAVGNWRGGCLRWGSVSALSPHSNEMVLHFLFELVKSEIVLERSCFTAHCGCFEWLCSCSVLKVTELAVCKKHASSPNPSKCVCLQHNTVAEKW